MIDARWHSLGMNTSKKFKIGDLVSWKLLGIDEKNFGIVIEITQEMKGGRDVTFAKVVCFKNKKTISAPIINLKKISENKIDEI